MTGAGRGRTWRLAREYVPAALLLAGLVGCWELAVALFDTKPYILPAPSRIWDAFLEIRGTLPAHTRVTMTEAVLGLALAAVFGILLASVIASVPLVRRVLYPLLVVSQTIPMIALAPLLIVWFGFGMMPKVLVVEMVGFFPIVVSTVDGLTGADPDMIALVRSMGANRWQVLRQVRIPAAIPAFFAGLKIAAAYAVTAAVVGEWVGTSSSHGLGLLINRSRASFRTDELFVAIAVISLSSVLLFAAVHLLFRIAAPWAHVMTREDSK